jgi:hypothetical protein
MFRSFRDRELAVLAPLLDLARQKSGAERAEWIADLRTDAPVLMARVEALLADEAAAEINPDAVPPAPVEPREAAPPLRWGWPVFLPRT